jgi:hypothetical protein
MVIPYLLIGFGTRTSMVIPYLLIGFGTMHLVPELKPTMLGLAWGSS